MARRFVYKADFDTGVDQADARTRAVQLARAALDNTGGQALGDPQISLSRTDEAYPGRQVVTVTIDGDGD